MSGRRPKPTLPPEQLTVVWQSVSLLLDYPDDSVVARTELIFVRPTPDRMSAWSSSTSR